MNRTVLLIIAAIIAYLIMVGIHNDWMLSIMVSPRQCVVDIFIFGFIYSYVCGGITILLEGFNIDIH